MGAAMRTSSQALLFREPLGLLELPRLLAELPSLSRQPRGTGQRVLVLPGYGANDGSTAVLRGYLRLQGYEPRGWGLGRNLGEVVSFVPRIAARLEELAEQEGGPVALVGWSLGGYLGRETARQNPALVRRVVTLGSPMIGGAKRTAAAESYERRGIDLDELEAPFVEWSRRPLEMPVTAIYSRSDGIVPWQACIDPEDRGIEHVEVRTTHIGLGFCSEVYQIIAERLGRDRAAR